MRLIIFFFILVPIVINTSCFAQEVLFIGTYKKAEAGINAWCYGKELEKRVVPTNLISESNNI
uniref:hypothetical protein n=1 Tax=Gelidibacter sp. TaxID=2018083 RepID=UPI0040496875